MKHKIGDKVRIKSLEWYNANKNEHGVVRTSDSNFVSSMSNYCGKVFTIFFVGENYYVLNIKDNDVSWLWTDEMFDETFNNNKDMEQKFKCKDEVIYQGVNQGSKWKYGIFSHYGHNCIEIVGGTLNTNYFKVLPYKGNEHLVGTTDSPEEEIKLEEGELVICSDDITTLKVGNGCLGKYNCIRSKEDIFQILFGVWESKINYKYCLPLSKFNPNDLEASKKEILKVENGKLVKVFQ